MQTRSEAEEHLRIIRSLMEKATIYRAISAPGALVAGICAVALATVGWTTSNPHDSTRFFQLWALVLFLSVAVNLSLLRRDAGRRGEQFFSPGMKLALRAMLPALIAGGLCFFVAEVGGCALTASLWVLLYGVSLLAASHFAPRSIRWLGRAFFVAGASLMVTGGFVFGTWRIGNESGLAHLIMGATFGLFHLIYAACTWPRATGGET